MNTELSRILRDRLDLYPHHLESDFPHIVSGLIKRWDSSEIAAYFHDLMVDTRGDRHGFPEAVIKEIFALYTYWRSLQPPQPRNVNNWSEVIELEARDQDGQDQ